MKIFYDTGSLAWSNKFSKDFHFSILFTCVLTTKTYKFSYFDIIERYKYYRYVRTYVHDHKVKFV